MQSPPADPDEALATLLCDGGMTHGDAQVWLASLPAASIDLFFTSPPYADARAYSRIHPDEYVAWFLPFAASMFDAAKDTGWMIVNIKNRVARTGNLRGQRHPYVYQLVCELQHLGWRWIETYIWHKTNAMPGKFGPRTKDSFEYVYAFARGDDPYFDIDAVRVPYITSESEIAYRMQDQKGRRTTKAGFGRDRSRTYDRGGADPGNVLHAPQSYNQHRGPAGKHEAVMPEEVAEFFIRSHSADAGIVIDPFGGSGTTSFVATRCNRFAGSLDIHEQYVKDARERIRTA